MSSQVGNNRFLFFVFATSTIFLMKVSDGPPLPTMRMANYLSSNMDSTLRELSQILNKRYSFDIEEINGFSPEREKGLVDIAFLCGLVYTQLSSESPAPVNILVAPVPIGEKEPVYYSNIIVQTQSRFQSVEDLVNCTWAYNEENSYSGYLVVKDWLAKQQKSFNFFHRMIKTGSHKAALNLVKSGVADAAAIDSQVLQVEMLRNPNLKNSLRTISLIGPSPIPPVVISRKHSMEIAVKVRRIFLEMHNDESIREILAQIHVSHFVQVQDRDYDSIREIAKEMGHTTAPDLQYSVNGSHFWSNPKQH